MLQPMEKCFPPCFFLLFLLILYRFVRCFLSLVCSLSCASSHFPSSYFWPSPSDVSSLSSCISILLIFLGTSMKLFFSEFMEGCWVTVFICSSTIFLSTLHLMESFIAPSLVFLIVFLCGRHICFFFAIYIRKNWLFLGLVICRGFLQDVAGCVWWEEEWAWTRVRSKLWNVRTPYSLAFK